MRVTISVGGRFHAFDLAAELERLGNLDRLITSYPRIKARPFGIPPEKIRSLLRKEILARAWRKFPTFIQNAYNPQWLIHEIFDRAAAKYIPKTTDIFTGWASFSLHGLRRAKELG